MKYIAKPVVIEAMQWDGTKEGAERIKKEFGFNYAIGFFNKPYCEIKAPGIIFSVFKGEYVIKDLMGEAYSASPSMFKKMFKKEAV